ncbi:hypothetical protein PCASD_16983 [Puccinia coronata f. sp. avenae]|uniref:Uncharacterized protein n=1 Tax=Puccinia coronata f. sp. avenae TaxID=200324 RepID=A0A2N5U2W9_9BASI|nr:hypothetical protein PCASD_16983 [Puccinia coronata f. sp. avenae]
MTGDQLMACSTNSVTLTENATASYQSLSTQDQTVSSTLKAINSYLNCFHNPVSVSSLVQYAKQAYLELALLVETCWKVYPQEAPSLVTLN